MTISIVRAELQHLSILAPLFDAYRVFYQQASNLRLAEHFLRERIEAKQSVIFLALDPTQGSEGGREAGLGFVQLYPSFSSVSAQRLWILNDLFVDAKARRRGVAQALMNAARDFAAQDGAKGLFLETAHDNHGAQALYKSLGYLRNTEYYYFLPSTAAKHESP
ncbi:GNAT family N-acetyltransferase [Undibacterium cyanobacteriorum]|uniref:GNAT family N-acetyltransferase n=1 Tax=Undibacterium cyanobacteriorum TaxID=3073561 RepID=A0ABY9RGM3_9BURK|nr:GNAT family N-acetyltransferase [Undibacterium sp. 20NA77.5]WMW79435.1 GNAT family N-acetyltransferase [Undibacterium sp. 20NA77.5]